ncbi:MAG: CcdB family protein [Terricaulis sp.]|nr:CcdB family protein [Terricaulis sp.]
MKQYDVINNPFRRQMADAPFLLVLQHDRNTDTVNVIVAPLSLSARPSRREVKLTVSGRDCVMLPMELTSMARSALPDRAVTNLAHESFRIQTALDIVFSAAG